MYDTVCSVNICHSVVCVRVHIIEIRSQAVDALSRKAQLADRQMQPRESPVCKMQCMSYVILGKDVKHIRADKRIIATIGKPHCYLLRTIGRLMHLHSAAYGTGTAPS